MNALTIGLRYMPDCCAHKYSLSYLLFLYLQYTKLHLEVYHMCGSINVLIIENLGGTVAYTICHSHCLPLTVRCASLNAVNIFVQSDK